jgi:lipoprotein-anchoring transpeptidase ErfK/SrfK
VLQQERSAHIFGHSSRALLSVSGAALLLAIVGSASPAQAQFYNYYGGNGGPAFYPRSYFDGGYTLHSHSARKAARRTASHPASRHGAPSDQAVRQKPTKEAAKSDPIPEGPLTLVVSIANQHVTVFDKDTPIMESAVSTGIPGHPTPTGIFSVIEKQRYHHSNIYSGAPMPYMQRITWSGIALHQGVVPGHPASHGCIRLPEAFANRLFRTTKVGVRVLVMNHPVEPTEFSHPRLFAPAPAVAAADPRDAFASTLPATPTGTKVAATDEKTMAAPDSASNRISDAFPAGTAGTTTSAPTAGAKSSMPVIMAQFPAVAAPAPAAAAPEKPLPPGPISVFISRKEGKLFVRKGFQPVFDVPVTIDRPDQALGTHLFTAVSQKDDGSAMRWLEVSVPQERRVVERTRRGVRETLEAIPALNPSEALERITIPAETTARISEMLTPGASLIISDQGLGPETGKGTDFVVLTKNYR